MNTVDVERLRQMKTLPSLVKFLRDELDWPVEADEIDELTFDYAPEELGLDAKYAKMVKEIKQIRPLDSKQPWGIFWVNFEKKRLPMVVLRRILGSLVIKRRASARKTDRPSWHLNDLLFISSYGEEEHRTISFAHFAEDPDTDQLPVLRVLGWDDRNSIMNLDRVANRLQSHLRWPDDGKDTDAWRERWSEAFTDRYREAIRSADELIPRLAALAASVRVRVRDVLHAEIERGPMRRLFYAVQKLLIHDMNEDGFADMYAQTVAYGLLSARFSRPEGLTAQNLIQLTAVSNPFLENLLENLFRLNRGKFHFDVDEVGINDVLDLLRNTNIEAIKAAFSDKHPAEDPVIRFYEGFLKQYDPQQRIQRGVFFTPRPVVSYIVRSVDELLRTEFSLEDGLASTATWAEMRDRCGELTIPKGAKPDDPFVCILDPAVGTGTFLFECIEVIERTMKDKWCRQLGKQEWSDPEIIKRWREYVPKHLLPRLYGYELMMAPCAIAHLKLALKLGETGYQFQEKDRLHVYLTNSLESPTPLSDSRLADMFTALASEAQEVNQVKGNKRFTVVIGNPPYSNYGQMNQIPFILNLLEDYKRGLDEKKLNLDDDFIKFIRYAQYVLDETGSGVFGMITNNTFFDGPTRRIMREHLIHSCDLIRLVDLHGSSIEREVCPDGTADENVFDIKQGVAISLLSTRPNQVARRSMERVCLFDLQGSRAAKYDWLLSHRLCDTSFSSIEIQPPLWQFQQRDVPTENEYLQYIPLQSVLGLSGSGVSTDRDALCFDMGRHVLSERMQMAFAGSWSPEFVGAYNITDSSSYSITDRLQRMRFEDGCITRCLYRLFDERWLYYQLGFTSRPAREVMQHMLKSNLGLLAKRQARDGDYDWLFVCNGLVVNGLFSIDNKGREQIFPLYIYYGELSRERTPNILPQFGEDLARAIGIAQEGLLPLGVTPEDVFHYAYAIFYSPTYRTRYADFLKIDFPRLPLTSNLELFRSLAQLGGDLVAMHLMESDKLAKHVTTFPVSGDNQVGKVGEKGKKLTEVEDGKGKLYVNKTQYFDELPEDVWNFHIGGYQVCHKWLADRKKAGRKLSTEDIDHYHRIVVAINETIRIMKQIDEVVEAHGGWPIK